MVATGDSFLYNKGTVIELINCFQNDLYVEEIS